MKCIKMLFSSSFRTWVISQSKDNPTLRLTSRHLNDLYIKLNENDKSQMGSVFDEFRDSLSKILS